MQEQWKKIIGFENYEISNLGQVKNKNGLIMKSWDDSHGYSDIKLKGNDGVTKHKKVHRLVAEAFILNPNNKKEVNHKDFDTKNNNKNNLEWVTPKENVNHMLKLKGISNQFSKFPKVACYDLDGNFLNYYENPNKTAIALDFFNNSGKYDSRGINDCCKGFKQSYKNYMFAYFEKEYPEKIEPYKKKVRNGVVLEAINIETNKKFVFDTVINASRSLNIDKSCIYDVLNGRMKKVKNFVFKRIEI